MNPADRSEKGRVNREPSQHARDEPTEEAQKSYATVFEQQVKEAAIELSRPALGLWLSSLSAGLDLGFGPFLMAVALTLVSGSWSDQATQILLANAYAVGFIFVVLGRSTLFTERTTSGVLPVLAREAHWLQLMRLWGLSLLGNLTGAAVIAGFIAVLGPALNIVDPAAMGQIAAKLLGQAWWVMLMSAVAAGWLMGLMTWLVTAARDTVGQILLVWMTAFVLGLLSLHHSIAGTIEILMAIFARAGPSLADYGMFIVWAVLGNAIGGSCFVALLKFGHVRASRVA